MTRGSSVVLPSTPLPLAADRYRIDRLRLRHLRLLQQIDNTRSLRNAAERIGVSQPAASLLLREMEDVFHILLVIRNAKGCRLTDAGKDILDRLSVALTSVDRALEASRDPDGPPRLRVGSVQLAGATVLPVALAHLEREPQWGRLSIKEGRTNELLLEMASGDLDCVIGWVDESTIDPLPLDQFRIFPLWPGRMEVIASASHPLHRRKSVEIAELAAARWIGAREGTRMHAAFVRLFVRAGIPPPTPVVESSAVHTTLNIVARTRMLAMSPDVMVASYGTHRLVKIVRGQNLDTGPSNVSFIIRRDNETLPILQRFRDALIASSTSFVGSS